MLRKVLVVLLCRALGLHRPPRGVDFRWSISFHCTRCHDVVPGGLATPVRRRR